MGLGAGFAPAPAAAPDTFLRAADWGGRDDDFDDSGGDVVDQAGEEPWRGKRGDGAEGGNIHGYGRARVFYGFGGDFAFRDLKIVGELGGIAGQAGDAAIGVLQDDQMKFSAASGTFPATSPMRPSSASSSSRPGVKRPPILRSTTASPS